ncbi:trypsin-like serine protease [Euzebya tangerina]|uniref:trypsin-like serine protease n=1 Tax=Euzebya tangerina TaxID=591198 RepID=UPI000E321048|nr:trypsin-like serine protease [Euzebya tangerina]
MTRRRILAAAAVSLLIAVALPAGAAQRTALGPPDRPWNVGQDDDDGFTIINGEPATEGEFPSIVAVFFEVDGEFQQGCGGTVVAPTYVLSAAHCFDFDTEETVKVMAGTLNYETSPTPLLDVEAIIRHPNWDPNAFVNDVALLRLAQPTDLPAQPLASDAALSDAPGDFVVAGWGTTNAEGTVASPQLLKVTTPFVADDAPACAEQFIDPLRHLCTGDPTDDPAAPGNDSCAGDSGGPLIRDNAGTAEQYGIVSFGGQFCGVEFAGVYTELDQYLGWVTGVLAGGDGAEDPDNPPPPPPPARGDRFAPDTPTDSVALAEELSSFFFFEAAMLARSDEFADALGGTALGGTFPTFYVDQDRALAQSTIDAIVAGAPPADTGTDTPPTPVYVLGGVDAIPATVDAELREAGLEPIRLDGPERTATAAAVAQAALDQFGDDGRPFLDAVAVARADDWADALTIGQLSGEFAWPVLLTDTDQLSQPTADFLIDLQPSTVYVVGGELAVSDGVAGQIQGLIGGGTVTRLGGLTRTETAVSILQEKERIFTEELGDAPLVAAYAINLRNDGAYAWALAATTFAGFGGLFLPLEGETGEILTFDVDAATCGLGLDVIAIGGTDAVTEESLQALVEASNRDGCTEPTG